MASRANLEALEALARAAPLRALDPATQVRYCVLEAECLAADGRPGPAQESLQGALARLAALPAPPRLLREQVERLSLRL